MKKLVRVGNCYRQIIKSIIKNKGQACHQRPGVSEWKGENESTEQSRARYSRFSRSRAFWCSHFPLGWQDPNSLVSFPFSRFLFLKYWSRLVSTNSFENLDILDQTICKFRFQKIFKPKKNTLGQLWIANIILTNKTEIHRVGQNKHFYKCV